MRETCIKSQAIVSLTKPRRQRQREYHQAKGVMSRPIAVHLHYKSLYISLSSSAKRPGSVQSEERKQQRLILSISIWNCRLSLHIRPEFIFRATSILKRSRQLRISLIKYKFFLDYVSSLASPSSTVRRMFLNQNTFVHCSMLSL